jgi:hypothetical protein
MFGYDGRGERFGNRAVGIGEASYLDLASRSRTKALAGKRGIMALDWIFESTCSKVHTNMETVVLVQSVVSPYLVLK